MFWKLKSKKTRMASLAAWVLCSLSILWRLSKQFVSFINLLSNVTLVEVENIYWTVMQNATVDLIWMNFSAAIITRSLYRWLLNWNIFTWGQTWLLSEDVSFLLKKKFLLKVKNRYLKKWFQRLFSASQLYVTNSLINYSLLMYIVHGDDMINFLI